MKYIKLFEDYSGTGENPSEITIRVTPQFVKEFKLSLRPVIEAELLSTEGLPGNPGVTVTKGQTKFIGLTREHEEWWKDNTRSAQRGDGATVSNKVKIDHVFWFAKYDPVIGEVSLTGVHVKTYDADRRKITELLDMIISYPDNDLSRLIEFDNVFFKENDMKMYRSLNCDFRGKFEEGSVDKDGYVELVSLK